MNRKLPQGSLAIIPLQKLTDYLLSENHPIGGSKATFFRRCGFDDSNVDLFVKGLRAIAREKNTVDIVASPHGTKYVVDGELETPRGSSVTVRTIWILERGQDRPRFVTAYPV